MRIKVTDRLGGVWQSGDSTRLNMMLQGSAYQFSTAVDISLQTLPENSNTWKPFLNLDLSTLTESGFSTNGKSLRDIRFEITTYDMLGNSFSTQHFVRKNTQPFILTTATMQTLSPSNLVGRAYQSSFLVAFNKPVRSPPEGLIGFSSNALNISGARFSTMQHQAFTTFVVTLLSSDADFPDGTTGLINVTFNPNQIVDLDGTANPQLASSITTLTLLVDRVAPKFSSITSAFFSNESTQILGRGAFTNSTTFALTFHFDTPIKRGAYGLPIVSMLAFDSSATKQGELIPRKVGFSAHDSMPLTLPSSDKVSLQTLHVNGKQAILVFADLWAFTTTMGAVSTAGICLIAWFNSHYRFCGQWH